MYRLLIFIFFLCSFVYLYFFYYHSTYILYPESSICGGFLGDSFYEENKMICKLPCNIINKHHIISYQNYSHCQHITNSVNILNNSIISNSFVIVKQHVVSNRKYFIYMKRLNVNYLLYV